MQKLNGYFIEEAPIGAGVFSQVFKGFDPVHGRMVAIKRTESIDLAQSEVQVMKAYGVHPHLPRLYDFFIHEQAAYLVMEFVGGPAISNHHLWGKSYSVQSAVFITIQILEGLARLHRSGFLHLDLQPLNIVFSDEGIETIKIVDFGSAVQKNEQGFWEGYPVGGTWEYMAPEQFERPARLDDTSDLYAAAGICVFMLTGRVPFLPPDIQSSRYYLECRELHQKLPELNLNNKKLQSILSRALHPDRKERYQTAEAFLVALRLCF